VVFGYAMAALLRPLVGAATLPWQAIAIRAGDRIGKGIRTAPRDALIADSAAPAERGRAFGFHRAMDHLGAAIGPLLAAAFLYYQPGQLRTLFWLTIIPGLAVVLLLALGLREASHETSGAAQDDGQSPLQRPSFRWFLASMLVFTLGNSSDSFLLVRAGELGVPSVQLPLLWAVFHVVKSAGSYLLGGHIHRAGAKPMIVGGWLVYGLVYLGFALAGTAWQVWALFLVYAIYYAATEPAEKTLVAELMGKNKKGAAYGWYNAAIGIAALPASALFGLLYQYHALAAFGFGAAMALLAVALLLPVQAE
jgi:MFS family permease